MKFSNPKYRNEQLKTDLENREKLLAEYKNQLEEHTKSIINDSHHWTYLAVKFAESKTKILVGEIALLEKEIQKIKNKLGE